MKVIKLNTIKDFAESLKSEIESDFNESAEWFKSITKQSEQLSKQSLDTIYELKSFIEFSGRVKNLLKKSDESILKIDRNIADQDELQKQALKMVDVLSSISKTMHEEYEQLSQYAHNKYLEDIQLFTTLLSNSMEKMLEKQNIEIKYKELQYLLLDDLLQKYDTSKIKERSHIQDQMENLIEAINNDSMIDFFRK